MVSVGSIWLCFFGVLTGFFLLVHSLSEGRVTWQVTRSSRDVFVELAELSATFRSKSSIVTFTRHNMSDMKMSTFLEGMVFMFSCTGHEKRVLPSHHEKVSFLGLEISRQKTDF
jgi:hypothetical protein